MRPVLIKWQDSRQASPGWRLLEDLESPGICQCRSVGYVVHEDSEVVTLAQSVGDLDTDTAQASGVMTIPVRCITAREEL